MTLIEFSYNNNYHSSIGMGPYEALYGKRCRTPLCWQYIDESLTIEPESVQATTEMVKIIQERKRAAQSRQKSYVDWRCRPLEFRVGDRVFLKVSSTKGIMTFGMAVKLSPGLDPTPSHNELGR